ncbi:hypothetical protein BD560DRAFT_436828 [Blakeslea trispora]|nr:hypothetical protein BD560DRAFT_436828 [Blakeslea trispora]
MKQVNALLKFKHPTHDASIALPVVKIEKYNELRKAKGQEQARNQSSSAARKTCGESGHNRSSSSKCKFHKASKQEKSKDITRTSVIKTNLNNICNVIDRNTLRRVHTILECESCRTVWNRDVNAAKNIHHVSTYQANHNNERPPIFQRPST